MLFRNIAILFFALIFTPAHSKQKKLRQTQKPVAAPGTYERGIADNYAKLDVQLRSDNKIIFSISAIRVVNRGTPYLSANDGDIAGEAPLKNNVANYEKTLEEGMDACKLQISFSATKAIVKQNGDCGGGAGVVFDGVYFKTSNAAPEIKIDPEYPDHIINKPRAMLGKAEVILSAASRTGFR